MGEILDYVFFPKKFKYLLDIPGYAEYQAFLKQANYKNRTVAEIEENLITVVLLMPYGKVVRYLQNHRQDIKTAYQNKLLRQAIADQFEVPEEIVKFRLAVVAQLNELYKSKGERPEILSTNVDPKKEINFLFEQAKQNVQQGETHDR